MDKNDWLDLLEKSDRTLYAPVEGGTPIDGLAKPVAVRKIYKGVGNLTKGFFRDTGWGNISKVWKKFDDMDLDWSITDSEYYKNDEGIPHGKIWRFEIEFVNKRGRPDKIYGYLTASGAGSKEDPLDRYDMSLVIN